MSPIKFKATKAQPLPRLGRYAVLVAAAASSPFLLGDLSARASGNSPLLQFSPLLPPTSQYENSLPFEATIGYEFALSVSKQVNQLGVYSGTGAFTVPVTVNLWNDNPLSSPLVSATIPAGSCNNVIDYFCWVPISPVALSGSPSGTRYRIGALYSVNPSTGLTEPYIYLYPLGSLQVVESGATYNGGYAALGDAYPTIPESTPNTASYFGPNVGFLYTPPPSSTGTPGPLPILGAASFFAWSRKLRRRAGLNTSV